MHPRTCPSVSACCCCLQEWVKSKAAEFSWTIDDFDEDMCIRYLWHLESLIGTPEEKVGLAPCLHHLPAPVYPPRMRDVRPARQVVRPARLRPAAACLLSIHALVAPTICSPCAPAYRPALLCLAVPILAVISPQRDCPAVQAVPHKEWCEPATQAHGWLVQVRLGVQGTDVAGWEGQEGEVRILNLTKRD